MHPKYTPSPRTCADCGVDISTLNHRALRCAECVPASIRAYNRERTNPHPTVENSLVARQACP